MARPGVNEWALVTGASGGLGAELARAVAAQGRSVVLTARSEASLRALAAEIGREHGVDAAVEPLDLSDEGSAAELQARLDARGIAPDLLVANAGFGLSGPFLENDPMRLRAMLQLNVVSLTELSWSLGRRMAAGRGGRILMVASLAAYQPCPNLAAYGASKAYILSVGEALDAELAPRRPRHRAVAGADGHGLQRGVRLPHAARDAASDAAAGPRGGDRAASPGRRPIEHRGGAREQAHGLQQPIDVTATGGEDQSQPRPVRRKDSWLSAHMDATTRRPAAG